MLDFPIELFLAKWGPGSLLALVILLILFGKLVPKSTVDDIRAQRDAWMKTADETRTQNTKLLESARVADDTFKALRQVAEKETE